MAHRWSKSGLAGAIALAGISAALTGCNPEDLQNWHSNLQEATTVYHACTCTYTQNGQTNTINYTARQIEQMGYGDCIKLQESLTYDLGKKANVKCH